MSRFILNPFFIIVLSYLLSCLLYILPFSNIYPEITVVNIGPVLFFIILNALLSILWLHFGFSSINIKLSESYQDEFVSFMDSLSFITLLLATVELLYYGIPLFGMVDYTEFGFPLLHVILVSGIIISSIFNSLLISRIKSKFYLFVFLIISILILNRFLMLLVIMSFIFSYMLINKIKIKRILIILILSVALLIAFGEFGLYRTMLIYNVSYDTAVEYILGAGYASDIFRYTNLPVSVFWVWLYITSPMSNLIYNIDIVHSQDIMNFWSFFIYDILPQTISKRIGISPINVNLIVDNLNVSTAISHVYNSLGYLGVLIYTLAYSSVIFLFTFIFKSFRRYIFIIFCSMLCVFVVFNNVFTMPIFPFSIFILLIGLFKYGRKPS